VSLRKHYKVDGMKSICKTVIRGEHCIPFMRMDEASTDYVLVHLRLLLAE